MWGYIDITVQTVSPWAGFSPKNYQFGAHNFLIKKILIIENVFKMKTSHRNRDVKLLLKNWQIWQYWVFMCQKATEIELWLPLEWATCVICHYPHLLAGLPTLYYLSGPHVHANVLFPLKPTAPRPSCHAHLWKPLSEGNLNSTRHNREIEPIPRPQGLFLQY